MRGSSLNATPLDPDDDLPDLEDAGESAASVMRTPSGCDPRPSKPVLATLEESLNEIWRKTS
jgi:hypothetical protein